MFADGPEAGSRTAGGPWQAGEVCDFRIDRADLDDGRATSLEENILSFSL